ncbi:MAG TPA: AAA family ATPase [Dehalococcoidia bacterium]|nr:AAA family ATPase [Dehalococcoidia bacterium]
MDELPHDDEAEQAVLGALLFAPSPQPPPAFLSPSDFYRKLHGRIYAALQTLAATGQPYDLILLLGQLESDVKLRVEDRRTIGRILGIGAVSKNLEAYARVVRQQSIKRLVITAASDLMAQASNGGNLDQVRDCLRASSLTLEAVMASDNQQPLRVIDLGDLDTEEPIPWVVQGWVGSPDIVVCGAEGGMGKSILGMELALALATNTKFADVLETYGGPYRVLMIDEEMAPRLSRFRLRQLIRGREIQNPQDLPLRYLSQNSLRLDDPRTRRSLESEIETFKPHWVILDTLIRFHAFEENSNTEMSRIFNDHLRPLRATHGCGFFVHHHLAKPTKERTEAFHRLRGAGELGNMFDDVWSLQGDRHTPDRTLGAEKCRWIGGAVPPPISLHYEEAEDRSWARLTGKTGTASAEEIIRAVIAEAGDLGASRQTVLAACELQHIPLPTAIKTLKRMETTLRKEGAKGGNSRGSIRYFSLDQKGALL